MIKLRVKETATNLVYFYDLDTIKTLDGLGIWFVAISSLNDLTIRRIQLIDSSGRNAEGAGSTEIDVAVAKNNLANSIREAHADTVSISALYKGVSVVIGVNCSDWTLSIVANKNNRHIHPAKSEYVNNMPTICTFGEALDKLIYCGAKIPPTVKKSQRG